MKGPCALCWDEKRLLPGYLFEIDDARRFFERYTELGQPNVNVLPSYIRPSERPDALWCWAWTEARPYPARLRNLREIGGRYYVCVRVGVEFLAES